MNTQSPASPKGEAFFAPGNRLVASICFALQGSAQKPTRERLQHDGNKKGQDQISSDRKAKAQSSISVLLQCQT
jgi:hypothetical protein